MPNQFKIDIVEKSTARLKEATGIYFAKYTGMNVVQATEFRNACRETSVEYSVVKNTLIKIRALRVNCWFYIFNFWLWLRAIKNYGGRSFYQ